MEPQHQHPPENDASDSEAAEAASGDHDAAAVQEQIERLRADLDDAHDRALRFQAELDNYRKRVAREFELERKYAIMPLLRDLLPVLDDIHRAVEAAEQAASSGGLLEGVRMVARQLEEVLSRHHCAPVEALHQPFDPHFHEAISQQRCDEHPPGTVIHVVQTGYRLHDRVVRPSRVIVSAGPPEEQR
jgi:molecular chaperone GrpE